MSVFNDVIKKIFGESVTNIPRSGPIQEYSRGGIFNRKEPDIISPLADDYQSPQQQQPIPTPTPTPPAMDYAASGLVPNVPYAPVQDPYDFPLRDKPPIPEQYRENIGNEKSPNIVASVMAQETGGYGYQVPDPETGEIVDWPTARERNVRGESGEVGIMQIIPKWHFAEAGFPDEESYAQALYEPSFAIQEGARILNHAFDVYGDWKKALNSWNKAPNYPDEVLARMGVRVE